VDGLPDGPRLLVAALEDLVDLTGIPTEDVAGWWREALVAYRADPTPAVADRILDGEGVEAQAPPRDDALPQLPYLLSMVISPGFWTLSASPIRFGPYRDPNPGIRPEWEAEVGASTHCKRSK